MIFHGNSHEITYKYEKIKLIIKNFMKIFTLFCYSGLIYYLFYDLQTLLYYIFTLNNNKILYENSSTAAISILILNFLSSLTK